MQSSPSIIKIFKVQWLLPLLLTMVTCLLAWFEQSLLATFQFDRGLISQGEYWRLLTGNFFHTNAWHLLFNLAGLLMLTHLFGRAIKPLYFLSFTLVNATLVGILLYVLSPDIERYVGLSGYLHGLFVVGCLIEIANGRLSSYFLLIGVALKIGWESFFGANEQMTILIDATVATDAHLFGALAALPWFTVHFLIVKRRLHPAESINAEE